MEEIKNKHMKGSHQEQYKSVDLIFVLLMWYIILIFDRKIKYIDFCHQYALFANLTKRTRCVRHSQILCHSVLKLISAIQYITVLTKSI